MEIYLEGAGPSLFFDKKKQPQPTPEPLAPVAETHGHLLSIRHMEMHEAIARAAAAGVRMLVSPADPSSDVPDVPEFLERVKRECELAAKSFAELKAAGLAVEVPGGEALPALWENVHIIAGVHPYGSARMDDETMARLDALVASDLCVGVGEIGIDYGPYNELPDDIQEEAFRRQLRIAHEHNLPVELHLRNKDGDTEYRAHKDAARILEDEGVPEAGCDLHCFTAGPELAQRFVELGCHIGFGGALTFARSDEIREAARTVPMDRILTETDFPYMTPVPLRGTRCEPAMVAFPAAMIAELRAEAGLESREAAYTALWNNACAFFSLPYALA